MFRVSEKLYDGAVNLHAGETGSDIEVIIPVDVPVSDDDLMDLKGATVLEDLIVEYGEVKGVRGTYSLCGWQSIENTRLGLRIRWQTYRSTDINQLRQENEDLTAALLELAAIVGGGNG